MPVQITGLSEVLRGAKEALAQVPAVTAKVAAEAKELVAAVADVDALANEMKAHTAEVRAVMGGITNGGPPLDPGK